MNIVRFNSKDQIDLKTNPIYIDVTTTDGQHYIFNNDNIKNIFINFNEGFEGENIPLTFHLQYNIKTEVNHLENGEQSRIEVPIETDNCFIYAALEPNFYLE